jgi:hypothetical protein
MEPATVGQVIHVIANVIQFDEYEALLEGQ